MPKFSDLYPSKYLKATDLPEGEDVVLTITHLQMETLGEGEDQEEKPILYFNADEVGQAMGKDNAKKGIVLNKTNGNRIAEMYGEDYSQWAGCRVALCVESVNFQGKMTDAIRIRAKRKFPRTGGSAAGPLFESPYGIAVSGQPVIAMDTDKAAVVKLLEEANTLRSAPDEVQKIRSLLKLAQDQCVLRHITYDKAFVPKTVGEAVAWLKALIEACAQNDTLSAADTPF